MTTSPGAPRPEYGAWVLRWLSTPRFGPYLRVAQDAPELALQLYEWNAQASAAVLHDLAHLEVGLRNAYNRALEQHSPYAPHWTVCSQDVFAPVYRTKRRRDARTGRKINAKVDINTKPRESLERAVREAGGPHAPAGKIVAQLMFGFWRYLSSSAHEVSLWRPYLHHAFSPGTARAEVDAPIGQLHDLRNRVAHHEPILSEDLERKHAQLIQLAQLIEPELATYIDTTSRVPELLRHRPGAR